MAFKTFANGFADVAARTAALPEPIEGMVTYLEDDNELYKWTGADWVNVAPTPDLTSLIPKSTVTTAGDLIIADGASSVTRLGVGSEGSLLKVDSGTLAYLAPGTDDQVLTLAAGTPTWADAAGGGAYTLLSTTTLSTTQVIITSISQSYSRLRILVKGLTVNSSSGGVQMQFRNGTTNLLNDHAYFGSGLAYGASPADPDTYFGVGLHDANQPADLLIDIENYASSSASKALLSYGAYRSSGVTRMVHFFGRVQSLSNMNAFRIYGTGGISFNGGTVEIFGGN
jgi:hypothetical protein